MRGIGSGHVVCFPDVHLVAASSIAPGTGIDVGAGRGPIEHVGLGSVNIVVLNIGMIKRNGKARELGDCTNLAVNELHVVRALSIAISSSVLGTSLVGSVFSHAAISIHGREIESSVKATSEVGNIDVESKLLVLQAEHLVLGVIGHEVDSASDVLLGTRGHELEREGVTSAVDTIGSRVVSTLQSAVACACGGIGAELCIPGVSGVTVGVASFRVEPAPVGVEDDLSLLSSATAGGTPLGGQGRVGFRDIGSNQLAFDASEDREDESKFAVHREEWTRRRRRQE